MDPQNNPLAIQFYDSSTIDAFKWPETDEGRRAKGFLLPLIKEGTLPYIANTQTQVSLLVVRGRLLPVTINDREYENSYLTSNYFAVNFLNEWLQKKMPKLSFLHKPAILSLGSFLKTMKINKTVTVNNWLLTTNLYPCLTQGDISDSVAFLSKRFPRHLIVMRSLDAYNYPVLIQQCKEARCRLICMRFVYIYDPAKKDKMSKKSRYHLRRDQRLAASPSFQVLKNKDIKKEEIPRLLELFGKTYFQHTRYSPVYTEKFMTLALENNFLQVLCLKNNGVTDGVMGYYERDGKMAVPFFGFENAQSEAVPSYRILTYLAMQESEQKNLVLNDGHGGESHKKFRGMIPYPEYTAFYCRHLPWGRRFFWWNADKIVRWLIFPLMKKYTHPNS